MGWTHPPSAESAVPQPPGPPLWRLLSLPVDGVVAVTAVVGYQVPSGTGAWTCSCLLVPRDSGVIPGTEQGEHQPSCCGELRCHRVVEVVAGSNQVAIEATASGTTVLVGGSISAVFSPFSASNP